MSATEIETVPSLEQRTRGAILAVKNAFGAPGDWGYETRQGDALRRLYDVFNEMVAIVLLDAMDKDEQENGQ